MNGFVAGVRYYDKTYSKHVKVLGWNPPKTACSLAACPGTGTFVGNFTDQTAGKSDTTTFFSEGADIVFPVAGSVGLGSVAAAQAGGRRPLHHVGRLQRLRLGPRGLQVLRRHRRQGR